MPGSANESSPNHPFRVTSRKKIVDIDHWRIPVFRVEEVKGDELRLSCEEQEGENAWVAIADVVEMEDANSYFPNSLEIQYVEPFFTGVLIQERGIVSAGI